MLSIVTVQWGTVETLKGAADIGLFSSLCGVEHIITIITDTYPVSLLPPSVSESHQVVVNYKLINAIEVSNSFDSDWSQWQVQKWIDIYKNNLIR